MGNLSGASEPGRRRKSDLRGAIGAATVARIAVLLTSFALVTISTRLVLKQAGTDEFGVIMLVSTIALLFPFADLGLGASVMSEIGAKRVDASRLLELRDLLGRVNRILTIVGTVIILIGIALFVLNAWPAVLNVDGDDSFLNLAATVTVMIFGVNVRLGVGYRVLIGLAKTHVAILCQLATPVVTVALAGATFAGLVPPAFFATAYSLGLLLANSIMCTLASRALGAPALSLRLYSTNRGPATSLMRTSVPMLVISVATPLALQSDRVVLAHVSSPSALTAYALIYQLYGPAYNLLTSAATPLWPHFARLRTRGGSDPWLKLTGGFALAGLITGGLLVLISPVYELLVSTSHSAILMQTAIAAGLLIFAQSTLLTSSMSLTTATGLTLQAALAVVACVLSIGGSLALASVLGAPGPLLASAAAVVIAQSVPLALLRKRLSGVVA